MADLREKKTDVVYVCNFVLSSNYSAEKVDSVELIRWGCVQGCTAIGIYSGPAVWSSLPAALRCNDVTLLTFRARLKAALFNT